MDRRLDGMSLSKLRETVEDRIAWRAAMGSMGSPRVGHNLETELADPQLHLPDLLVPDPLFLLPN